MKSHCDGEVWGLYVVEDGNNMFLISSADDGRVIISDPNSHKSLLEIPVKP